MSTALVLSGSIGEGHGAVANACTGALVDSGIEASTLDCMSLMGGPAHRVGEAAFRNVLAVPPLFDALHFSHLRTGSALADRMEQASARRLLPALRSQLASRKGGLLLSVFATGAGASGRLKAEFPSWRSVVFCTDATAHRLWVHPGVERYLVGSATAAATVREFLPRADVVQICPSVRDDLFEAPPRALARHRLGLDGDVPCVLLMGGAWGLAPIDTVATALASAGYQVLAVAGRNPKLESRLRSLAGVGTPGAGGIVPFGFTDRIPELMAAADVVVTTPGQTCHEARVVNRPLVVLDSVPGHGRENLLLELGKGGALASLPSPGAVVRSVGAALEGAASESEPWPVSGGADWRLRFMEAVGDLVDGEIEVSPSRQLRPIG